MIEITKIRTIVNTISQLCEYKACQEYAIILNALEIRLLELMDNALYKKECQELLSQCEYLRSTMVY